MSTSSNASVGNRGGSVSPPLPPPPPPDEDEHAAFGRPRQGHMSQV